jgi:hypothetical protein
VLKVWQTENNVGMGIIFQKRGDSTRPKGGVLGEGDLKKTFITQHQREGLYACPISILAQKFQKPTLKTLAHMQKENKNMIFGGNCSEIGEFCKKKIIKKTKKLILGVGFFTKVLIDRVISYSVEL